MQKAEPLSDGLVADPEPEPEPEAKSSKTEYVILSSLDGGETWVVEGRQAASGKSSALSHFYDANDLPEDTDQQTPLFQAIPSSSWKPFRPAAPRPSIPFSEVE